MYALQSNAAAAAIICMTWTSLPIKDSSAEGLLHDMVSRYRRHCPQQDEGKRNDAAQPASAAPERATLTDHDYATLDVLCCADAQGTWALPEA